MSSRERRALVVAGSVLLLGAIVATALILSTGGSRSNSGLGTPRALPAATRRFPGPPRGAVVYAREDGADALALAVVPQAHGAGLQASVVGGDGTGVAGLGVSFRVMARDGASTVPGTACGAGCYHASVKLETRPLAVRVRFARPGRRTTWNVTLPGAWPPAGGSAIIAARYPGMEGPANRQLPRSAPLGPDQRAGHPLAGRCPRSPGVPDRRRKPGDHHRAHALGSCERSGQLAEQPRRSGSINHSRSGSARPTRTSSAADASPGMRSGTSPSTTRERRRGSSSRSTRRRCGRSTST